MGGLPLCRCVGLFLLDGDGQLLYILLDRHKEDLLCKENKGNETIEAEGRIRITFTNRAAGKTLHTMFPKKSAANKSLKLVPSCRKLRFSSSGLGNKVHYHWAIDA